MLHIMETTSKGWKHVGILVDDEATTYVPPTPATPLAPTPPPLPEPPLPPPVAPATVMGYHVGDCHTYTKEGKSVMNKALWAAGFRWTPRARTTYPVRYRNGNVERFRLDHYLETSKVTRIA